MITLLAIDDDPRTLALIAATLEQDGLEILTCEDPEKASRSCANGYHV